MHAGCYEATPESRTAKRLGSMAAAVRTLGSWRFLALLAAWR